MLSTVNKAICRTFLCALAFASLASGQVVEKGRTLADLIASHPCASGLENRIARVTDCDAADDIGNGGGAFQCWAICDGSAPWANLALGGGNVVGPDAATDNALVAFSGTTGKLLKAATVFADGAVITVAPSGADFTTVQAAVAYVDSLPAQTGQTVVIRIADGTYANVTPIDLRKARQVSLSITGTNTYARTMSSVQSSSGSAGAWSIILNVNSVANIAVNDWVLITAPSGGTLPTYIAGAHKVTNVDAVNTRITITSVHKNATAPSGAVAATVTVLKTILTFTGSDGVRVWDNAVLNGLNNLMLVGDGTTSYNGVSVQDSSRFFTSEKLGVANFSNNVLALYSGSGIVSDSTIVSTGGTVANFKASDGGVIALNAGAVASGGHYGITAERGGIVSMPSALVTGHSNYGIAVIYGGIAVLSGGQVTGNLAGLSSFYWGYCNEAELTFSNNTNLNNTLAVVSGNGITAGTMALSQVTGLSLDATGRKKTITYAQSSPFDQFIFTANSSTGGWKGVFDFNVSMSAGTPFTALRLAANTATTSIATLGAALVATPATVTVASAGTAIPITATTVEVTTDGNSDEDNGTLANGAAVGQILYVYVKAVGNAADSFKITPATMLGGTKISFAASPLGKGCTLMWTASGWVVVGSNGGTVS